MIQSTKWMQVFLGKSDEKIEGTTKRHLRKQVISIAFPALAELMFIQLASIVDNAMVGRLGNWAMSAVGYTTQPIMLLLTAIQAIHTGATALIARKKGEQDPESANKAMGITVTLSLAFSILVAVFGSIAARPLVILMGAASEQAIEAATSYFVIRMYGLPVQAVVLACSAALRGVGKTRVTMVYNSVGNIINVFANYALIYGGWGFPKLGVAGAAWATVFGMVCSGVIAVGVTIKGSDILKLRPRYLFAFSKKMIRSISVVGTPALIEQLLLRAGLLIYMRIVAFSGEDLYAVQVITQNIMVLTFCNGQAFGIAATSLMGQNIGAGRMHWAETCTRMCSRYCLYMSTALILIFVFGGQPIASLYTTDAASVRLTGQMLLFVAAIQPMMGSQLVLAGALRGAGDAKKVTQYSGIGILFIRPICCVVFMYLLRFGLAGAWMAYFVDQGFRSIMTLRYYVSDKWKSAVGALS